ncbi:hypothetical protein BDQ17DRAFT_1352661 [Cyathus striatus]|nr:hypothetical protein BDQ17DRAFT_1352661 [Cyathus striatus]
MRRSPSDRRNKPLSQAGSVAGEDADLSDMDQPSETGSLGGRSNATGGSNKKRGAMTIEEREAAYKEARTRIFMDFEEKEKEKDLSTSSSSVVSGSASTNGGSVGDIDDTGSSPATESEWSGPVTRDKNRRGGSGPSMRRSGGPYGNSSGSSRNSRAPSPSSFTYASLYEPPPSAPTLYDPNQPQSNTGYQYVVPYPQGPNPPYISPYYYPYHTYHPHPTSDPTTPANGDPYTPQQPMQTTPSAIAASDFTTPLTHQNSTPIMTSPPGTQPPQYAPQQYMPSHAYTYPPPPMAYYPPPGQHMPPPPPNMGHPLYDVPHGVNGSVSPNGFINSGSPYANGIPSQNNGNANANGYGSNRNGPTVVNGGKGRAGTMPGQARASWSFGPGISGGYSNTVMNGASQNSRASSICDDVSSTASSSTTSSSSRRTYTSTASSQHPLPARPDWAVGMKAQPTLTGRHHDGTQRSIPGISPQRNINGNSNRQAPLQPPASLQSMDFPPLSSMAEKRTPVVAGAWGNVSSTRSILQANSNQVGNVVASPTNSSRLEEPDKGFERPPPKSAQLFNPKSAFKSASMNGIMASAINGKAETEKDKERVRSDTVASAILVDGVNSISLENTSLEKEVTVLSPS